MCNKRHLITNRTSRARVVDLTFIINDPVKLRNLLTLLNFLSLAVMGKPRCTDENHHHRGPLSMQ